MVSAVSAIDESAWTPIEYTADGEAEVAECDYKGRRLIVRRTRLIGRQATLWPEWRHFAFVTDLEGHPVDVDAFHRDHARVELAIRDLKEGAGLEHVPSGQFFANAAWLLCAVLAHDLIRWTAMLGEHHARRPAHRGAHRAHPVLLCPGPPGQPFGHADAARPARVAMGRRLPPRPHPLAKPATGPRVGKLPAGGAPQKRASGADIDGASSECLLRHAPYCL